MARGRGSKGYEFFIDYFCKLWVARTLCIYIQMPGHNLWTQQMTIRSTLVGLACAFIAQSVSAEDLTPAQTLAAKGVTAAEGRFEGYSSLCDLDRRIRNVNVPRVKKQRPAGTPSDRSPRSAEGAQRKPIPPTQVFDNLWFLGTPQVTTWLYGTAEGYVLIDGLNTDEEAQEYVLDGMAQLGLDPSAIEMILVTHGHGDHYGGADYLADTLGVDIFMSQPDWDLVSTLGVHPRFGPPPASGKVVADGDVLHFGRSEMQVHITPGHTPGTVSPVFEVRDGDTRHMAMIWGGTGFNFGPDVGIFEQYADSASKMRTEVKEQEIAVFLSGHPGRDGTLPRLAALADRSAEASHPFVRGQSGLALFDVLENCALAQAARFRSSDAKR